MTRAAGLVALAVLAACWSPAAPTPVPRPAAPAILAALPKPEPVDTARFAGVIVCARCHTAGERAMRDAEGRDISPVTQVVSSMMGLAARDPYFLAALRREIDANPGAKSAIEATCLGCHAPVGRTEDPRLTLEDVTSGTGKAAHLARDGVGCAGCHALDPAELGDATASTIVLRTDRVAFGALPEPLVDVMLAMSRTRPVPSAHVSKSRLCASCHTVAVHALDRDGAARGSAVLEQTTYLEWRNSIYQDETAGDMRAQPCQACHMPRSDTPVAYSTRPPDSPARDGYRRHELLGGNAYLLEQLARDRSWLAADARGSYALDLVGAAARTREFLTTAARLAIRAERGVVAIDVLNRTGHKLPTGYPSRRMWLHVTATDETGVIFESGAHRDGAIVGRGGARLDGPGAILPHRDRLATADDVAVWEAVPVDASGARTHLLLGMARFAKDDRILPSGWRAEHPDGAATRPIGTDGDPDFRAGQDTVTVELPRAAHGPVTLVAELLYQSIPPETLEAYPGSRPEAARFRAITDVAPTPIVLARTTATLR